MRKQSHFYLPWKFIERDTSPEDFFYSFTPENIIEHRTFVLCSQIFSPLYFSVNQAIWQLTRGNNCIFTNSLQPIVNLFNFFFFQQGLLQCLQWFLVKERLQNWELHQQKNVLQLWSSDSLCSVDATQRPRGQYF